VRRIGAIFAILVTAIAVAACGGSSGKGPVTLTWAVFPEPSGSFAKAAADCSANSHGAYTIKINFLSNASDQQRQTLVQRLAASIGPPSSRPRAGSVSGRARIGRPSPRGCCPDR
jgi:ABC-type glycerol-3-phosphate transport system substrate-binding protein